MELATREIMWNIPSAFKILMYVLFAVSLAVMAKGLYEKFAFITNKKSPFGPQGLLPGKFPEGLKELNWQNFFQTIFFQGKVRRKALPGFFHSLIYYGFIVLWIATDLVAIHYDTPFKVFQGTTYIVISFLADCAGVLILIGLALAYYRRYVKRPDYLKATKPYQERFMYGMLANLVVIGFLIEGIRILGTHSATNSLVNEKVWAPVGWSLAMFFQALDLSDSSLALLYRSLWFIHMVSTMAFIASIGYSKFSHVIFAPFSALVTPNRRGGILFPMDFENEEAETFGLGKVSELTTKQRFDTQVCVECGRCTQACPANLAGKPLDPKLIVTKMRDFIEFTTKEGSKQIGVGEGSAAEIGQDATPERNQDKVQKEAVIAFRENANFWENPIYSANELDACTTCGACMQECPVNIEHVQFIMDLKRYKVLTLGDIPPSAADATSKIKVNGNPWGIAQDDRFKWADGLEVPVIEEGKKVDYLYYVGCAGSYDNANQQVVKDTIGLLKKAGVSFAVMGKTEKCNGDPVRRFGDEYSFYEIAIENIANMRQYTFDKVVTHCPHCLHTIGKEYAKFEDGQFTTVHHTQLLAELIQSGKLKPQKTLQEERTFHDPCYLGRHHGEYNAPRFILESIPGIQLKEMERTKDKALCCGMGGGNMWYELPEGEHLANNRLHDIADTKVEKLSTACSYCMINFNSAKGHNEATENIAIEDIATTLSKSVM